MEARMLLEKRSLEAARELLGKAIELDPLEPEAFTLLALVYEGMGYPEKQAAAEKRARQLEHMALNDKPPAAAERYAALLAAKREPEACLTIGKWRFGPLAPVPGGHSSRRVATSTDGAAFVKVYEAGEAGAEHELGNLRRLTEAGCQSAPALLGEGTLATGERYAVLSYTRADRGGFGLPEILLALLEQQALGVYPGRIGLPQIRYDSLTGLCRFSSYSTAVELDEPTRALGARAYLDWCVVRERERCGREGGVPFIVPATQSPEWIWKDERLNLMATQAFRHQRLGDVPEPSVQTIDLSRVLLAGSRPWTLQAEVLDRVAFAAGERVLDLGCGLGAGCQYLARRGCAVTGVDVEDRMLDGAKLLANLAGVKVDFRCHDLDYEELPGEWETVLLLAVLHHFFHPEKAAERLAWTGARRLIIEAAPREQGYKWFGRWYQKSGGWTFEDVDPPGLWLKDLFSGYSLMEDLGPTEHGRHMLVFERQAAP